MAGYSKKARLNAAKARSIKALLGPGAYAAYKKSGTVNESALKAAREKRKGGSSSKSSSTPTSKPKPRPPAKTLPDYVAKSERAQAKGEVITASDIEHGRTGGATSVKQAKAELEKKGSVQIGGLTVRKYKGGSRDAGFTAQIPELGKKFQDAESAIRYAKKKRSKSPEQLEQEMEGQPFKKGKKTVLKDSKKGTATLEPDGTQTYKPKNSKGKVLPPKSDATKMEDNRNGYQFDLEDMTPKELLAAAEYGEGTGAIDTGKVLDYLEANYTPEAIAKSIREDDNAPEAPGGKDRKFGSTQAKEAAGYFGIDLPEEKKTGGGPIPKTNHSHADFAISSLEEGLKKGWYDDVPGLKQAVMDAVADLKKKKQPSLTDTEREKIHRELDIHAQNEIEHRMGGYEYNPKVDDIPSKKDIDKVIGGKIGQTAEEHAKKREREFKKERNAARREKEKTGKGLAELLGADRNRRSGPPVSKIKKLSPKEQKVFLQLAADWEQSAVFGDNFTWSGRNAYLRKLKRAGFKVPAPRSNKPPPGFQD